MQLEISYHDKKQNTYIGSIILIQIVLQDNIIANIETKKEAFPRFAEIQNIWVGAEYLMTEEAWKWSSSYVDFNGNIYLIYI